MKRKKRKGKEGFLIERSEEGKKGKTGGKQNNSRSINQEREQKVIGPDNFSAR